MVRAKPEVVSSNPCGYTCGKRAENFLKSIEIVSLGLLPCKLFILFLQLINGFYKSLKIIFHESQSSLKIIFSGSRPNKTDPKNRF